MGLVQPVRDARERCNAKISFLCGPNLARKRLSSRVRGGQDQVNVHDVGSGGARYDEVV